MGYVWLWRVDNIRHIRDSVGVFRESANVFETLRKLSYPDCDVALLRLLQQHPVYLLEPLSQGPYTVFARHCANCLVAIFTHNPVP